MKYDLLKKLRELSIEQLADIALKMGELHPSTFERILAGTYGAAKLTVPYTNQEVYLTPVQIAKIRNLVAGGTNNRVAVIKLMREYANLGLKEAKELCDREFYPQFWKE